MNKFLFPKTSIQLIASERLSEHHLELQVSGTLNVFAPGSVPNIGEGRDKNKKNYTPKPEHCLFTPLHNYKTQQTASSNVCPQPTAGQY